MEKKKEKPRDQAEHRAATDEPENAGLKFAHVKAPLIIFLVLFVFSIIILVATWISNR